MAQPKPSTTRNGMTMQPTQPRSNSDHMQQFAILGAIAAALLANILSNLFPLGGQNIGEISNTVFKGVLIIPANYAFAIWGLIYVGLIALGVYQFLPEQRSHAGLRRSGYWLVIASIAQIVWVYLFLARLFALSVVAMLAILIPLAVMYGQLGIGHTRVSRAEKWFVHIPISVYLGWISVATIVNVASALYAAGWNGGGLTAPGWTVLMLLAATAIAFVLLLQRHDPVYPLVIAWALTAIAVKHADQDSVSRAAIALAVVLLVVVGITQFRSVVARQLKVDRR